MPTKEQIQQLHSEKPHWLRSEYATYFKITLKQYETLITKYKLCLNSFKESTLQNPERTQHFNGILKQHGINI